MTGFSRALVLAPHTDDAELGCGGTIARLLERGVEVYLVAFSAAERSVPPGLPRDTLRREQALAAKSLGLDGDHLRVLDFPVREFPRLRQEVLEEMVSLESQLRPDLVLLPSTRDTHQDHQVIAQEGFRAFKRHTVLGYDLPWNTVDFPAQCFVPLEERHLRAKIRAVGRYRSQGFRPYSSRAFLQGWARMRGVQAGCEYAEAFEVVRWLMT